MSKTDSIGEKTEAVVLSALIQIYPAVLVPFGNKKRYDFVFEDFDGNLKKVQSKTARYLKSGVIQFNTSSIAYGAKHKTYEGQIDFFGVYCPLFTEVYLVPIEITGLRATSLRVEAPSKPYPGINWAVDYLLYSPCQ